MCNKKSKKRAQVKAIHHVNELTCPLAMTGAYILIAVKATSSS